MIAVVGSIVGILILLAYMVGAMYATLGLLFLGKKTQAYLTFASGIAAFLGAMLVTFLIAGGSFG